jgi:hypothetical protein
MVLVALMGRRTFSFLQPSGMPAMDAVTDTRGCAWYLGGDVKSVFGNCLPFRVKPEGLVEGSIYAGV